MATKDLSRLSLDLQRLTLRIESYLKKDALQKIGAEAILFGHENFDKQGFQGASLQKWKPRKTRDRRGRDLTRYRRGRNTGQLTKFGRDNKDRAILIKSNDMRHSLRLKILGHGQIGIISTDYAAAHNFGAPSRGLPARPFIGASPVLARRMVKKTQLGIMNILRRKR